MKKNTLSLLAIFAFSGVAFAQTPDIKLGAKAGLNISTVSNDDDSKSKAGFHIGAVAEIFLTEKFSIQPEILYSSQGTKGEIKMFDDYGNIHKIDATVRLNYINIPVMAKYYVMDGLSIQAGPQIGFNVKAESEAKYRGQKETADIKDLVNTVDFGLNFGAGYELPFGLFFDARYNVGLTKVLKEDPGSSKNRVFQLSVGYKF